MATWQKVREANPAATTLGNNVAFGLNSLAQFLIENGRPGEALEALAQAQADPPVAERRRPRGDLLPAQPGAELHA